MNKGQRIKQGRIKKGMSQDEMAKKIGCSRSMLSLIESEKNNPTVEILEKISEILEISNDYLITGRDKQGETISIEEQEIIEMLRQDKQLNEVIKLALDAKKKVVEYLKCYENKELIYR